MALSLVCAVLVPCIRFYCSLHRSLEDDILNLQLPPIIDTCFFAVEKNMRDQMRNGDLPCQGEGYLGSYLYTSQGNILKVSYTYTVNIRKAVRNESRQVNACFADVEIHLFAGSRQTISIERSVCVVL
ncbi:putative inner membrane protein [Chlamydia ibidis]|uniref:Inner membrane protein n=3 Tax=Chlamydia ibidis TaxID=1405396 RepID=A0ABP2XDW5_9CHLA|nr:putative inner membrane protein [Chlamydia ibidis]EQM62284.1 putative inner membrane protein [Chlamydia ibidis 10-1398/6]